MLNFCDFFDSGPVICKNIGVISYMEFWESTIAVADPSRRCGLSVLIVQLSVSARTFSSVSLTCGPALVPKNPSAMVLVSIMDELAAALPSISRALNGPLSSAQLRPA